MYSATQIDASNFVEGVESLFSTVTFDLSSKSDGVNEKKATSAPDIKAEQRSNTSNITILVI